MKYLLKFHYLPTRSNLRGIAAAATLSLPACPSRSPRNRPCRTITAIPRRCSRSAKPPHPCESRHDGADRHFGRLSNFAVIQALDVAQHQRFPERRRQSCNCGAELIGVDLGEEGFLWRLRIRVAWIGLSKLDSLEIIDGNDRSRP